MTTPCNPSQVPGVNRPGRTYTTGLDTFAVPLARTVLDCVADQLALTLGGPVDRLGLYPGEEIAAMDHCCGGGQLAVRIYRIFPVTGRFPQQDFSPRGTRCMHLAYGVTLEVTVYRCACVINERGEPPSIDCLMHDVAVAMDDAAAIRRAIRCCYSPRAEAGEFPWTQTGDVMEDDWNPVGPAGDCHGGRQRLHFPVFDTPCDCPPNEVDRGC